MHRYVGRMIGKQVANRLVDIMALGPAADVIQRHDPDGLGSGSYRMPKYPFDGLPRKNAKTCGQVYLLLNL
jgi:hypothetical protein